MRPVIGDVHVSEVACRPAGTAYSNEAFTSLVSALLSPETAPARVPGAAHPDDDGHRARWDAAKADARPATGTPAPARAGSARR